jgi:hypothetical protein
VWPFEGRKPPIRGTKARNAKTGRRLVHRRMASVTLPYRVILQFRDPTDGHLRTAVVDPDMVID